MLNLCNKNNTAMENLQIINGETVVSAWKGLYISFIRKTLWRLFNQKQPYYNLDKHHLGVMLHLKHGKNFLYFRFFKIFISF